MRTMHHFKPVLALAAALALVACGTPNTPAYSSGSSGYSQPAGSGYASQSFGVVQSIDLVRQGHSGIGGGAVAGALIGGIVGNQVGSGDGKTAATVLGAVGGAYAGNQIQKRNEQQYDGYKFTIRMRDGSYETVMQASNNDIQVGDRVQIDNGVVRRY